MCDVTLLLHGCYNQNIRLTSPTSGNQEVTSWDLSPTWRHHSDVVSHSCINMTSHSSNPVTSLMNHIVTVPDVALIWHCSMIVISFDISDITSLLKIISYIFHSVTSHICENFRQLRYPTSGRTWNTFDTTCGIKPPASWEYFPSSLGKI